MRRDAFGSLPRAVLKPLPLLLVVVLLVLLLVVVVELGALKVVAAGLELHWKLERPTWSFQLGEPFENIIYCRLKKIRFRKALSTVRRRGNEVKWVLQDGDGDVLAPAQRLLAPARCRQCPCPRNDEGGEGQGGHPSTRRGNNLGRRIRRETTPVHGSKCQVRERGEWGSCKCK